MLEKSLKPSFIQSAKSRIAYLWRGIWTSFFTGFSLPLLAFRIIFGTWPSLVDYDTAKGRVILAACIAFSPLIFMVMLSGGVIGALIGAVKGLYQALTRQPIKEVESNTLKTTLAIIEQDPLKIKMLIRAIIRDYESKRGIHSTSSKSLVASLKNRPSDINSFKDIRTYLVDYRKNSGLDKYDEFQYFSYIDGDEPDYQTDNRGKRLYNVIYSNLFAIAKESITPEKAEIRKNMRILVQAQRTGHPLFERLPYEIVEHIATATNSSLARGEAREIAESTYNSCRVV